MSPDRNQLKYTIANGDDTHDNVLILNVDGTFELCNGAGAGAVANIEYISRWETFDAGNDYVGINASEDEELLNQLMEWAEEMWAKYRETGKTRLVNHYA